GGCVLHRRFVVGVGLGHRLHLVAGLVGGVGVVGGVDLVDHVGGEGFGRCGHCRRDAGSVLVAPLLLSLDGLLGGNQRLQVLRVGVVGQGVLAGGPDGGQNGPKIFDGGQVLRQDVAR